MGIETDRQLELFSTAGDKLMVRRFEGTEHLGRCFEYHVTLYSLDHDIKMQDLLGTHATVRVRTASTERFFDGIVFEFSHIGHRGRYAMYQMTLRPWLYVLAQNRDCRIFQDESVVDIVKKLVKERGLGELKDEKLMHKERYKPREYCVQYRESTLNFISRLLESEGIYYYFMHEKQKHTLMLADDSVSSHLAAPGFEKLSYNRLENDKQEPGVFFSWSATKRVQPGKYKLKDFDFKKPLADLKVDRTDRKKHQYDDGDWYDYHPGTYEVVDRGNQIVQVRSEERLSDHETSEGETDAVGLYMGCLVELADHPRKDQNRKYLVVGMSYTVDSGSFESGDGGGGGGALIYQARVRAIPSDKDMPYRPLRITRPPIISGAQTAIVVGGTGQEIHTDPYGRVKVQFHWDRRGNYDQKSSCFIRVAQIWAGARWGAIFIPRVGHEVVVEFLEGDPDKPLITGSVYNDNNKTPYLLDESKTWSGIKTHSTPKGSPKDYNELCFIDTKGEEKVHIQAQKDFTSQTEHDSTHEIKNNLSVTVVDGKYDTLVKTGKMTTKVAKNAYEVDAATEIYLHVGENKIVINTASITLQCGTSKITMTPAGLMVEGKPIKLN